MAYDAKLNLIWENTADTPLNASNLSKALYAQHDSKFINYANLENDYRSWSDYYVSTGGNIEDLDLNESEWVGKIVYSPGNETVQPHAKTAQLQLISESEEYTWVDTFNPYQKLLKIRAQTKIACSFYNKNTSKLEYLSFDAGSEDKYFSIEQLLLEPNLSTNSTYGIYLYYHIQYNDYAEIKIVNEALTPLDYDRNNTADWRNGNTDSSSPSGHRVVCWRKIGEFKTNLSGYINEDSLWDLSTLKNEVISKSYKVDDNGIVRRLKASDLNIDDYGSVYLSSNVETALNEVKQLTDKINLDTYNDNKYGFSLEYSPLGKNASGGFEEIINSTNRLSLRISKGFIDVNGVRLKYENDIYLSDPNFSAFIGTESTLTTSPTLGVFGTPGKVYEGVWRVYLNQVGNFYIKSSSHTHPQKRYSGGKILGWYDITTNARCIGKFRVIRSGSNYYVEKMSVNSTVEDNVPKNTLHTVHSTLVPDGLLPCDGRWHDVNGVSTQSYSYFPSITNSSEWPTGAWYEETPNMLARGIKNVDTIVGYTNHVNQNKFALDSEREVSTGGSNEAAVAIGTETHSHYYEHKHAASVGNEGISITGSGSHDHIGSDIDFNDVQVDGIQTVQDSASGVLVSDATHNHPNMTITGGNHQHSPSDFSGSTANLEQSGYSTETGVTSSWPPVREYLICIKK